MLRGTGAALLAPGALAALSCGVRPGSGSPPPGSSAAPSASPKRTPGVSLRFVHDKPNLRRALNAEARALTDATGLGWQQDVHATSAADYIYYVQGLVKTPQSTPDLFTWWSSWPLWQLAATGVLDDLSDIWQPIASQYVPWLRRQPMGLHDRVVGLPFSFSLWLTFYNTSIFDRYGLKPPQDWDEMNGVIDTLQRHDVTPLGTYYDGWEASVYFQTLLSTLDPDTYKNLELGPSDNWKFTNQPVIDAMSTWAAMLRKGCFNPPGADPLKLFTQGKVAMLQMGSWIESSLAGAGMKLGKDFSAFVWPQKEKDSLNVLPVELAVVAVPAAAPHRQQAREALQWFLTRDAQHAWVNTAQLTSPRPDVPSWSPVDRRIGEEVGSNYEMFPRFWDGFPSELAQFAVDRFSAFMRDPSDPQGTLQAIQQKADEVWPKMVPVVG
jgi:multiple sugar transport system substrate-binding protein